jgi:hypothetical protein
MKAGGTSMNKQWIVEASAGDQLQDALLNNALRHDSAGNAFDSMEECFYALDDFCRRKGLDQASFNVTTVEKAA